MGNLFKKYSYKDVLGEYSGNTIEELYKGVLFYQFESAPVGHGMESFKFYFLNIILGDMKKAVIVQAATDFESKNIISGSKEERTKRLVDFLVKRTLELYNKSYQEWKAAEAKKAHPRFGRQKRKRSSSRKGKKRSSFGKKGKGKRKARA
jgi:hypothetical protein